MVCDRNFIVVLISVFHYSQSGDFCIDQTIQGCSDTEDKLPVELWVLFVCPLLCT